MLFSPKETSFCLLISVAGVFLYSWLLTHNDSWCFRLDLKQVQFWQSAPQWLFLRQLKYRFFELTICLRFTESFTSVQSFILCPVLSHSTHFRFVAFCWRVLKFLSLRIEAFSFPVFVTGFLSTHYLNGSISCHTPSSLTKSDRLCGSLSSVLLTYPSIVLSFPIISRDSTCVSSFSYNSWMRIRLLLVSW